MSKANEVWKPVVGYEGLYEISNIGNVRTVERIHYRLGKPCHNYVRKTKVKKLTVDPLGYKRLSLCKNGIPAKTTAHRLVAKAFIPNPENKPFINHKNGITGDNRVENLEWCTNHENILHSVHVLKTPRTRGEQHGKAILTEANVRAIRKSPKSNKELGKKYGVQTSTIYQIRAGHNWKHVI